MKNSRFALVCLAACVVVLSSCGPKQRMTVFDPAEYEPFDRTGTGVIEGQAFIRKQGGGVVTAAGGEVSIRPATRFSDEWYQRSVLGNEELDPAPPEVMKYWQATIADADGRFSFEGLPAGEYYVTSLIKWEVPVGYYGGGVASTRTEAYVAHAKATVKDGQVTRAIVTR